MTADVTGTDILRATARNRARENGLARLARDYHISLTALDAFAYHGGRLEPAALQALAKDFFSGFAEFDPEIDRLRSVNRAEPTVLATAMPPQCERRPLSEVAPPRVPPKSEPPQLPARISRPGWAE